MATTGQYSTTGSFTPADHPDFEGFVETLCEAVRSNKCLIFDDAQTATRIAVLPNGAIVEEVGF